MMVALDIQKNKFLKRSANHFVEVLDIVHERNLNHFCLEVKNLANDNHGLPWQGDHVGLGITVVEIHGFYLT